MTDGRIGGEVGYCVRFDDQTSAQTRAKFMTDGILVRECLSDPELSRYQAVMLDVSTVVEDRAKC